MTSQRTLRQKSQPVTNIDQEFLERLALTLKQYPWAIGISAIQVGRPEQYIILRNIRRESEKDEEFFTLINPVITKKYWQENFAQEGCLSFPRDKFVGIFRSKKITFNAMDHEGEYLEGLEADGLLARAILHEIDHLEGILIIDYLDK